MPKSSLTTPYVTQKHPVSRRRQRDQRKILLGHSVVNGIPGTHTRLDMGSRRENFRFCTSGRYNLHHVAALSMLYPLI